MRASALHLRRGLRAGPGASIGRNRPNPRIPCSATFVIAGDGPQRYIRHTGTSRFGHAPRASSRVGCSTPGSPPVLFTNVRILADKSPAAPGQHCPKSSGTRTIHKRWVSTHSTVLISTTPSVGIRNLRTTWIGVDHLPCGGGVPSVAVLYFQRQQSIVDIHLCWRLAGARFANHTGLFDQLSYQIGDRTCPEEGRQSVRSYLQAESLLRQLQATARPGVPD